MTVPASVVQERLSQLPAAAGLERLWAIISTARLVGGSVRDVLCGAPVHDLDLASPLPPEEAQERLEKAGAKVVPTGLAHGTITAVIDHHPYEITTLRRDVETDGRHAVVAWTDDWQEDAARRDFTINAMSLDRDGTLYDFFHGQEDLAARRVRFVGQAAQRIEEDALRALRFFRFQARYGGDTPDPEACAAITQHCSQVAHLSVERIATELLKIVAGPNLERTVRLMDQTGLLRTLLPHAEPSGLASLLACGGQQRALVRLYALSPDPAIGQALKLSNADKAALNAYAQSHPVLHPGMDDDDIRRARVVQGEEVLIDRTWLAQAHYDGAPEASWDRLRARIAATMQPEFPLSGRDGLALGLKPGPELGQWIKKARAWWMEQGCRPDRQACQTWLMQQLPSQE